MTTNNKISNLINSQVPFFVRNDHQKFISFIEAYYEYLEQANTTVQYGKTVERAKNLLNYIDVDKTLDGFAEHLYSYYLHNFPKDAKGDKSLILKHAKDFYRAKGTQKSVDFLMRVLFNQEPTYYYPKDDILRASDGKWFVQKSLRITDTKIDGTANSSIAGLQKYVGTRIRGLSSNAEATIESTDTFYEFGTRIDELSISSIKGTFDDGEGIITYYTNENGETKTITSNVFGGIVNSITITNGGSQYQVGDPVLIVSATGSGACAKVALVSAGDVASISVLEGGAGFQNNDYVLITGGLGSGANAQVSAVSPDGLYHPPSYNIVSSIIALEANTTLENAYPNLSIQYAVSPQYITNLFAYTQGITKINLSSNIAYSNIAFANNSVIEIAGQTALIVANTNDLMTIYPPLSGNVVYKNVKVRSGINLTNLVANSASGNTTNTIYLKTNDTFSNAWISNSNLSISTVVRIGNVNTYIVSSNPTSDIITVYPEVNGNITFATVSIIESTTVSSNLSVIDTGHKTVNLSNTPANSNIILSVGASLSINSDILQITSLDPLSNIITVSGRLSGYTNNGTVIVLPGQLYNARSNLTVNTGSGALVNTITLSDILSHSNVYFETFDSINVNGNIVIVTSSNTISENITVSPGLPGNIVSNGFYVIKKPNANTTLINSFSFLAYANTGPVRTLVVNDKGTGYASVPSISIIANTRISELGILGRMNIVSRGSGYSNTDWIEFINVPGGYGSGANANVIVNATGSIVATKFTQVEGQIIGGSGYSQDFLPIANIVTSTGVGGEIQVVAVLGDGETLISSNTTIGAIQRIVIESGGSGYKEVDTVDLTGSGDGTAQTVLGVVQGVYEYPGRWLNDDGQLSSYNFLQDRDYYQNYSYVVRIKESIDNYRKALKDLIHPAGMKLFGEYVSDDDTEAQLPVTTAQDEQIVKFYDGDYNRRTGNLKNIVITLVNHGQAEGNTVYLEFIDQESNVNTITILDGGAGYNANGYLYFTGDGSDANASYTFIPNSIARIGIVDGGAGYNANGYLSVTGAGGTGANISYSILPNSILSVIVTSAGAGFNTNGYMLITGGSNAQTISANISFTTKSNNINNIIITNPGEGYNSNGFMTFTGGNGGSNANVGYFIKTNNISSITITDGGVGYNSNGYMTFTGGGGGNANVGFIFKPSYVMSPIYITNNGGAGYNSNGFIIVTGASGTTANISYRAATNALFSISITDGGTGYNANGFVTVSGDSNAFSTGNVSYTIKTENVQSISITSGGAGYNVPSGNLVFTGGSFTTRANGTFTTRPNSVLSINIVSPGSNVNQNGFLTFTSSSGVNFNAAYIVGNTINGQIALPANTRQRGVVRIDINNIGSGFTDIPTINITSTGFVANLVYPTLTANMQNTINVITLTERASGYLGVPTLTANTTNVTPAVLVVNMQNLINSVTINNPGAGYLTIPTITANGSNISPATFSVQMQNSIISATVVDAGSNYNVMPTFTIAGSNIAPATVKIDMQNTIGSVIINSRGDSYTGVPVITANGSNITPATFVTNMQNLINNVIIYSRGDSYTNGVVVTANGSNSVPATFTTFMQNIIDQVIVNNTGTFYIGTPTLTPDVTYTTPATFKLITKNSIANLAIVNPGKGFTALPVANAIGSNASPAVFQIITQNVINSVTINNPGDMFLYAPQITAIGSNSTPALFTANLINLPLPNSGIFKVQNVQNANAFIVSQNTSLAQTIGNVSVGLIVT